MNRLSIEISQNEEQCWLIFIVNNYKSKASTETEYAHRVALSMTK